MSLPGSLPEAANLPVTTPSRAAELLVEQAVAFADQLDGLAPDDSAVEPYLIELLPPTDACPVGPPAAAVGVFADSLR